MKCVSTNVKIILFSTTGLIFNSDFVTIQRMETNETTEEIKEIEGRIYELGYLLLPTVSDEGIGAEITKLKDELSKLGGKVIADELPKILDLSYEMDKVIMNKHKKYTRAYFGWIKFEGNADITLAYKDILDQNNALLRFIIIRTVRENTLSKKTFTKSSSGKRAPAATHSKKTVKEPKEEVNKVELDKKLEEIVV
ncbi:hypothetical protein COB64_00050 [Candidatus Wolfebacteria bacterium]|nr:MAG: hypothetical protein COB64_00050 [Candidatus Wolfebacteria bacterium]